MGDCAHACLWYIQHHPCVPIPCTLVGTTGIRGLWALRPGWLDAYDTHLVLTFVGETRVLAITAEDELEEVGLPGLDSEAQTWLAANTLHDQLLQVSGTGATALGGGRVCLHITNVTRSRWCMGSDGLCWRGDRVWPCLLLKFAHQAMPV
jgi:hypothetical protein